MSAPVSAKPQLQLRPLDAADLPAALALTQALHWSHQMHDWQLHLAMGQGLAACDADGTLLGTTLWWDHGGHRATLGLVVVRPDCQGRGIGRQLLQAILAATGARPVGLVATAAGLRLYADCGFVPTGGILQCQGAVRAATATPGGSRPDAATDAADAATSLRRYAPSDRAAVLALDTAAFGAPRTALLDAVLATGRPAHLALRAGRVVGFALQRPAGRGTTVGPLVATDETTAIALARQALDTIDGLARLDIPAAAEALAAALAARGLAIVDRVTQMMRGAPPAADPATRLYGLVSQAFG